MKTQHARIQPLRVVYFGTYRAEYSRNQIMIEALRSAGVEVQVCQENLWWNIEDRVHVVTGKWFSLAFLRRLFSVYYRLLKSYASVGDYDVLVCGYPGQLDVYLARILSWIKHKPLVWDIFMSIYLISLERGLDKKNSLSVRLLRILEYVACRLPDKLVLDTSEYVKWFDKIHQVHANRFFLVPTGADDRFFTPQPEKGSSDTNFRVLYYGTFIPNHHPQTIVEAARLLEHDEEIQFVLVGEGPDRFEAQRLADSYNLQNILFLNWMSRDELVDQAYQADICLGAFGDTPQSVMTIQNKVYEALAMARPIITGDSPAVRQSLQPGVHLEVCTRKDPNALAATILKLKAQPALRKKLMENGLKIFQEQFCLSAQGKRYSGFLKSICK